MRDKKHIDRLFQEGFKDFEAVPNNAVWDNIEAKLNQNKKKRRIIPVWWRYAGIAALLVLTVSIAFFNNTGGNIFNQAVNTKKNNSNNIRINRPASNQATYAISNTNEAYNSNDETLQPKSSKNKGSSLLKKTVNTVSASKQKTEILAFNKPKVKNNIVDINSSKAGNKEGGSVIQKKREQNIAVVRNTKNKSTSAKNKPNLFNKEKIKTLLSGTTKSNVTIANSNNEKTKLDEPKEETPEKNKISINDALNKTKDSVEENDDVDNKWTVTPNIAPVYFNTLGQGSSIDPQFNNNTKTGELNISYGISASYAINKKLSIRSGINKVSLSYNTKDVVVFQSAGFRTGNSALQNINVNNTDNTFVSATGNTKAFNTSTDTPNLIPSANASINQGLDYIEIPLEIQYALSNKKFGINLIGGFSSFFLSNNEIFSEESNGNKTFFGEANNINKASYSANFGLGLKYEISKKFDLNLEPIFKYQFNTFNNASGNFSPFVIGVYTGVSVKF